MSGDTGRQTSSEVAHEAEDTRASLASTLEQLRNNLRPENVMEEVVANAKIGASSVADNLVGVARQHPIPAALIAAGSALIMSFFSKRGGGETTDRGGFERGGASRPVGTASARPPMLRNPTSFTPAQDRGATAASGLGASLAGLRDDALHGLSAGGAALKEQLSDAYDTTSSQAGDAMQSLSRYVPGDRSEVRSKLANLLDEQPLILGAIGLAIGAAIGAALPITQTEDGLMGSTAHRFRDSASDAARHEVDSLRAAAGEAIDNVRHSASDSLSGFVKDIGDHAKTVADKAGDTVAPGSREV